MQARRRVARPVCDSPIARPLGSSLKALAAGAGAPTQHCPVCASMHDWTARRRRKAYQEAYA
eukprot:8333618-Lingulodinium_polyedra.AAC.1